MDDPPDDNPTVAGVQEAAHMPEDADPEYFMTWTRRNLQDFVVKYGFKVSGTKAALAAYAFVIVKKGFPELPGKAELLRSQKEEYQKTITEAGLESDPYEMKDGWVSETEEGYNNWPPITIADLVLYLSKYNPRGVDKAIEDYKSGYALFKCDFVKEVRILKKDGVNLLMSQCTPEERITEAAYEAWVAADDNGTIKAAYCSCTGG